jgi:hypothetical protein
MRLLHLAAIPWEFLPKVILVFLFPVFPRMPVVTLWLAAHPVDQLQILAPVLVMELHLGKEGIQCTPDRCNKSAVRVIQIGALGTEVKALKPKELSISTHKMRAMQLTWHLA